ncbi:hypothetical protein R2325_04350 [Mycobacteroides chelonae]|nr:hypothetical protein [Mycobacteroides chelonae]MEC4873671.1 hypothetical protein [Mycobacteroides chelonae]
MPSSLVVAVGPEVAVIFGTEWDRLPVALLAVGQEVHGGPAGEDRWQVYAFADGCSGTSSLTHCEVSEAVVETCARHGVLLVDVGAVAL